MELTNAKYLERGLRMSGDKPNADLVRDMAAELASLLAENERLRGLVCDSVSLFDNLFEPGDYAPGVSLFCEHAKEALK